MLMMMRGGTVVTLNYDNTLELAGIAGAGLMLDPGPYPRDPAPAPGWDAAKAVRIVNLHGSFNWIAQGDGSVKALDSQSIWALRSVAGERTPPPIPGIIFGAGNKLRPDGPYLDLYLEFKTAVRRARRLIVIGYGWIDEHVNEVIASWIQRRDASRVLRVSVLHGAMMPEYVRRRTITNNPSLTVQVVSGPAGVKMVDLMSPTDDLQR
jgi:hypothetical protein